MRWHYDSNDLYSDLNSRLVGAFEVAEACLGYATWKTRGGWVFDSEHWRELDVAGDLCKMIPITIQTACILACCNRLPTRSSVQPIRL